MSGTGQSSTVAFGTSGFSGNIHVIGGTEMSRDSISDSNLTTTTFETSIPADLVEPGEFQVEFEYDPNTQPPISGVAETITVTSPVPSGSSNAATLAGTGYCTKFGTPSLQKNTLMMATATIKWDGKTGPAFTDAS